MMGRMNDLNRRTAIAAILAIPVMPQPRYIWVYYSDAPFGMPWVPTWVRCRLRGENAVRDDGKRYLAMSHVRTHLYWIDDAPGARLNAPTEANSRGCPPRRLPF